MKKSLVMGLLLCLALNVVAMESGQKKLSQWYPKRYSELPQVVNVANRLWLFGSERGASIYDFTYQQRWHQRCEQLFVNYSDAHDPDRLKLSRYAKSKHVLHFLQGYFDEYEDCTTAGMLTHTWLENCFLYYAIVTEEKVILRYNKNFVQEIRAWERLHKALDEQSYNLAIADEGEGTMARFLAAGIKTSILEFRQKDVLRICTSYRKKSKAKESNVAAAKHKFQQAVMKSPIDVLDKKKLVTCFNQWLVTRKDVPGTAEMVSALAGLFQDVA